MKVQQRRSRTAEPHGRSRSRLLQALPGRSWWLAQPSSKHMNDLSDQVLCGRCLENPYFECRAGRSAFRCSRRWLPEGRRRQPCPVSGHQLQRRSDRKRRRADPGENCPRRPRATRPSPSAARACTAWLGPKHLRQGTGRASPPRDGTGPLGCHAEASIHST